MSAEAGSFPARNTLAKSWPSVMLKSPVISLRPPEIGPVETPGAEYTILSSTIAMLVPLADAYPVLSVHKDLPLHCPHLFYPMQISHSAVPL